MKSRSLLILVLLLLPLGTIVLAQGETPLTWQTIAEGIEYRHYQLNDPVPVNVFVARMDRDNPAVVIESSIAQGKLSGGLETVSDMAARYDQALNFWGAPTIPVSPTWGTRNQVVVAINGFYYGNEIEPPGVPWSGQVHSGWYAKRYYDEQNNSGFIWKTDRNVFIGGCILHPADKQLVYFEQGGYQYLDGLNSPRGENDLILFTPQYNENTNTDDSGVEVLVEMEIPTQIALSSGAPQGIVRAIYNNQGSTPLPFDHIVLSAQGSAATKLRGSLAVGDRVAIAQRVKDCPNEPSNDWTQAYAGVGGDFHFLENGQIREFDSQSAKQRHPRTAIAYNSQYIFFVVADGRDPGISEGMKIAELADFAQNVLAATDGIAQDGGGSSTMVINGQVVNNTFCNNVFCAHRVYLPIVATGPSEKTVQAQPSTKWDQENQILQRLIANGMMIVVVEPMQKSERPYHPSDPITTLGLTQVRLGPGTNYQVLDSVNADGTIQAPLNDLGGVLAKGTYWWKVDFGSIEGWVAEENITARLKFKQYNDFRRFNASQSR